MFCISFKRRNTKHTGELFFEEFTVNNFMKERLKNLNDEIELRMKLTYTYNYTTRHKTYWRTFFRRIYWEYFYEGIIKEPYTKNIQENFMKYKVFISFGAL